MIKKSKVPKLRFPEFTDEWQVKELSDIASSVSDRNGSDSAEVVLTNSAAYGIVPQSDFFDKDIAVQGNLANYFVVSRGDFVYNPRISTSAPVGPFNRNNFGEGVMSPLYSVFRFGDDQNLYYIESYLKTAHWHRYMKSVANYGARHDRMAISSKDLKAMPIPYPSSGEQQKIADFIGGVDAKIAAISEKVAAMNDYKRGVMQAIFSGKLRFKDENGNPYPDWEVKKLGDIIDIRKGVQINRDNLSDEGYPVINGGVEPSGYTDKPNTGKNKITISEGGNSCGYVNFMTEPFWSGGHCYVVDEKDSDVNYIFQLLKNHQTKIQRLRVGSGLPNIQRKDLLRYKVECCSNKEEQQKIADFLSAIDAKIQLQETKLEQTKEYKKGLLQRMFV